MHSMWLEAQPEEQCELFCFAGMFYTLENAGRVLESCETNYNVPVSMLSVTTTGDRQANGKRSVITIGDKSRTNGIDQKHDSGMHNEPAQSLNGIQQQSLRPWPYAKLVALLVIMVNPAPF